MQNPLWAFQTLTVVSLEADITEIIVIKNGRVKCNVNAVRKTVKAEYWAELFAKNDCLAVRHLYLPLMPSTKR